MSKQEYGKKFKNTEFLSNRIKKKTKLIKDLEAEAEKVKSKFENEIVDMSASQVEAIFSQYLLA